MVRDCLGATMPARTGLAQDTLPHRYARLIRPGTCLQSVNCPVRTFFINAMVRPLLAAISERVAFTDESPEAQHC